MKNPLVTVAVASYNNADYLVDTLESIRQQDYPNWELIVVDDCSRDASVAVAGQWLAAHPKVRGRIVENATNLGICGTFNHSIRLAKGEYYSLIGSDDLYMPDKLSRQVAALEALPEEYGLVYGDITNIDEQGRTLHGEAQVRDNLPRPEGDVYLDVLRENFIPAMGQLMRLSVFNKIDPFDETLAYEDWDMWLRLTRVFKVKYLPGVVARYRLHERSVSVARRQQLVESSLRLLEKQTGQDPVADRLIGEHMARYAEALAWSGNPEASHWLRRALALRPQLRPAGLLAITASGLSLPQVHRWYRALRGRPDATAG